MHFRAWTLLAAMAAFASLAAGCVITTTPTCGGLSETCCSGAVCNSGLTCNGSVCQGVVTRAPYQTCGAGDACGSATSCQQSNVMSGSSAAGAQCTVTCTPGVSTCPLDGFGNQGVCVATGTTPAQCFQDCTGGVACGFGFTCTPTSTRSICIPNGGTATCGGAGQACCGGATCTGTLACVAGLCQQPVVCGGPGQACCAGATCTGGLACSGGVCQTAPPLAYEGCTPIGAQCGSGTTCQSPMVANPGATGWCTIACTSSASMCPNLPGAIVDCYILQNAIQGQCYVACPDGTGCPTGTQCNMVNTMTATGVRICMPPTT